MIVRSKYITINLLFIILDADILIAKKKIILCFQVVTYGLKHETGSVIEGQPVTVKDILKDVYERACHEKHWALVRHTAGNFSFS